VGIQEETETSGSGWYEYSTTTTEVTPVYWIGLAGTLIVAIWEVFDAGNTVDEYNKERYKEIMGDKSKLGFNLIPSKDGASLMLTYQF